MLRDRIVCGVNHEGIMNHLLSEKTLNFDSALQLAKAIESAERDTRHLQAQNQSTSTAPQVHYSSGQKVATNNEKGELTKQASPVVCYRRGGPHLASRCRFSQTVCHACKKRGHLARVCRSKANFRGRPAHATRANHLVEPDEDEAPPGKLEDTYTMITV